MTDRGGSVTGLVGLTAKVGPLVSVGLVAALLAGCTPTTVDVQRGTPQNLSVGISEFRSICLGNLPDFTGWEATADGFGHTETSPVGRRFTPDAQLQETRMYAVRVVADDRIVCQGMIASNVSVQDAERAMTATLAASPATTGNGVIFEQVGISAHIGTGELNAAGQRFVVYSTTVLRLP